MDDERSYTPVIIVLPLWERESGTSVDQGYGLKMLPSVRIEKAFSGENCPQQKAVVDALVDSAVQERQKTERFK